MTESNQTAVEDLKTLRNYILGVIAFASAVSTFLIQVFHFPVETTLAGVVGLGVVFLAVVFLINRAEKRSQLMIREHIDEAAHDTERLVGKLESIDSVLIDIQKSTLRTEMNDEITRHPHNHDTILRMAQKYFVDLQADWIETDIFLSWVDAEKQAGRPVNIPPQLFSAVTDRKAEEMAHA